MQRDWKIIGMQVLTAGVTVGMVVMSIRLTQTIRTQWENTAEVARRGALLSDVQRSVGYGGMIHALKNYVIRGDEAYIEAFDESYADALGHVTAYQQLTPLSDVEQRSLEATATMINDYRAAMNKAIAADLAPADIDRLIRIDDGPTLKAFDAWTAYLGGRSHLLTQGEIADIGVGTASLGAMATLIVMLSGVGVICTVCNRKRELNTVSAAAAQLQAASRAKTEFLANMSHEIRTPMTSIVGFASMIAEQAGPELKSYTDTIQRNARHLMSIVDDVLDIAVIEAGRLELAERSVSPSSIAEDVKSMLTGMAERKGVALHVDRSTLLPRWIRADGRRLRQILLNLAGNSVKFTDAGSVRIAISFEPTPGDEPHGMLVMEVRDTGKGIPKEDIERMFSRFEQADGSSTRRHGGVGLGLAISQSLVEAMGGRIEVESTMGSGSLFRASIPVRVEPGTSNRDDTQTRVVRIEPPQQPEAERPLRLGPRAGETLSLAPVSASSTTAESRDASTSTLTRRSGILSGLKVLVVEDGPDNRNLLMYFLTDAGAQVDFAENGAEALERIAGDVTYDVVVMDLQMPVMDGVETTYRLRSDGFGQSILGLTAHAMESAKLRLAEAGCNAVLTKPVVGYTLVDEVRRLAREAA